MPEDVKIPGFSVPNHPSALEHVDLVTTQLESEAGIRILDIGSRHLSHSHPLAAIYRADSLPLPDVRVIHNLSAPVGRSVNDFILYMKCSWHTFDTLADFITPSCFVSRVDVKWFYRHFLVDPSYWYLLGFRWRLSSGSVHRFWDCFLNFGLRSSGESDRSSVHSCYSFHACCEKYHAMRGGCRRFCFSQ